MLIKFYGYNTFTIESGNKKIAIDPGGSFYLFDFFKTLIPKSEWKDMTHIFVTHGDPDHHWHTDRVAEESKAAVICSEKMVRTIDGKRLMLGPRNKGLTFICPVENLHTLRVDETIMLDGMSITGVKGTHGPITLKLGPFKKTLSEGPEERMGYGEMGFKIELDGKTIVNLGDTILYEKEWGSIQDPDVLMIPIGGKIPGNTMDEKEALKAVQIMKPKKVIPCHYDCPAMFSKCYNPADDEMFKKEVENMGFNCVIMHKGDSIEI